MNANDQSEDSYDSDADTSSVELDRAEAVVRTRRDTAGVAVGEGERAAVRTGAIDPFGVQQMGRSEGLDGVRGRTRNRGIIDLEGPCICGCGNPQHQAALNQADREAGIYLRAMRWPLPDERARRIIRQLPIGENIVWMRQWSYSPHWRSPDEAVRLLRGDGQNALAGRVLREHMEFLIHLDELQGHIPGTPGDRRYMSHAQRRRQRARRPTGTLRLPPPDVVNGWLRTMTTNERRILDCYAYGFTEQPRYPGTGRCRCPTHTMCRESIVAHNIAWWRGVRTMDDVYRTYRGNGLDGRSVEILEGFEEGRVESDEEDAELWREQSSHDRVMVQDESFFH